VSAQIRDRTGQVEESVADLSPVAHGHESCVPPHPPVAIEDVVHELVGYHDTAVGDDTGR
jgi:hypothetical protein